MFGIILSFKNDYFNEHRGGFDSSNSCHHHHSYYLYEDRMETERKWLESSFEAAKI